MKRGRRGGKLGKFQTAIEQRDWLNLRQQIEARCEISALEEDPCWRWEGARTPNGYAFSGRGETRLFVHRLVSWADTGWPGELHRYPPVHHICGVRDCVNPQHVRPVTAVANALEANLRNYLARLIDQLYDALEAVAPDHELLSERRTLSDTGLKPRTLKGRSFENPQTRVMNMISTADRTVALLNNRNRRYAQVIAVDKLVRAGKTRREARTIVGISRSGYDDWSKALSKTIEAS